MDDDRTGDGDEAEDIYRRSRMNYKAPGTRKVACEPVVRCEKLGGACQEVLRLVGEAASPESEYIYIYINNIVIIIFISIIITIIIICPEQPTT